jgi:NTP pyrophosphatase (non-canonical NTP hydrolase)
MKIRPGSGRLMGMEDIQSLTDKLIKFRKQRDWEQFHKPKDLALSLVLEAAEVLEHFQWRSPEEVERYVKTHKKEIGEELADVFNWVLILSHDLNIDILKASETKIRENAKKYPVQKAKGKHSKYTEL